MSTPITNMSGLNYGPGETDYETTVTKMHAWIAEVLLFNGVSSLMRVPDDDDQKTKYKMFYLTLHVILAIGAIWLCEKWLKKNPALKIAMMLLSLLFPVIIIGAIMLMYLQASTSAMDISKSSSAAPFSSANWNNLKLRF